MSQQIEIEFKNLLTKDEFQRIQKVFYIKSTNFSKQINHYFDTDLFSLKELGSALRIREKNGFFELTLKQPVDGGLLETNQKINSYEAEKMLRHLTFPEGKIRTILQNLNINLSDLEYLGSLTTLRAEQKYKGGLLVFDHSYYLNKEDFEIEYEVTNREEGQKIFMDLLNELNIPLRNTENKIKRFFKAKNNL
ncbi:CYTH domain-containing protein [Bacillus methanolicus]|uniref:CYTH domain-containing protein n=1 Tax=Bacillus methanolicus TaxID=1471 RepID=UPI00200E13C4|nr:CYTH domain-containing protein [Bacillus methanolicus]UQD51428.1 CYTH domain-containing protein [Bacillus methanolicus]